MALSEAEREANLLYTYNNTCNLFNHSTGNINYCQEFFLREERNNRNLLKFCAD